MNGRRSSLGSDAEDAVADFLYVQGFTILGRNLRLGPLELDLVAQKGALAVVVEVRTRSSSSFDGALSSITPTKRRNLLRATERLWCQLSKRVEIERLRIDVAAVTFGPQGVTVEYFPGAITAQSTY
ncbi:MAG: YraN family protein [Myxococcales bacterium]